MRSNGLAEKYKTAQIPAGTAISKQTVTHFLLPDPKMDFKKLGFIFASLLVNASPVENVEGSEDLSLESSSRNDYISGVSGKDRLQAQRSFCELNNNCI